MSGRVVEPLGVLGDDHERARWAGFQQATDAVGQAVGAEAELEGVCLGRHGDRNVRRGTDQRQHRQQVGCDLADTAPQRDRLLLGRPRPDAENLPHHLLHRSVRRPTGRLASGEQHLARRDRCERLGD